MKKKPARRPVRPDVSFAEQCRQAAADPGIVEFDGILSDVGRLRNRLAAWLHAHDRPVDDTTIAALDRIAFNAEVGESDAGHALQHARAALWCLEKVFCDVVLSGVTSDYFPLASEVRLLWRRADGRLS